MLTTLAAVIAPGATTFTFLVPGNQLWSIRSVYAVATRDAGGAPDRAYKLTVSAGATIVALTGAPDAGAEPGTCAVTWANAPGGSVDSDDLGFVLAPFNPPQLQPGYTIAGEITNAAGADEWASATCWYDFVYNTPQ